VLAGGLSLLAGCEGGLRTTSAPRTQAERLQAAYPDLATGRFWVIADFEDLRHGELFRMDARSQEAGCIPGLTGGLRRTGQRCLRVTLADPADRLIISSAGAHDWSLRRDWREFFLLLAAVHCPAQSAELDLALVAGPPPEQRTAHSRTTLTQGWNLLRLDLTEAAEHVPIDDIREIHLALPSADGPVTLLLDDLILADNSEALFGAPNDPKQGLYIRQQGRRWNVGAAGRFELGFANGQIVHWYDLAGDPHRLSNLAGGRVLGPSPIVLPSARGSSREQVPSDFAGLGEAVVARQRILEANPVCIVVECTWHFTSPGRPARSDDPFQRWIYTIDRSGRVHIHVECTTASTGFAPRALGLAVSRHDDGELDTFAHQTVQLSDPEELRHVAYSFARPASPEKSGLLYVIHDSRAAPVMKVRAQPERQRVNLIACGGNTGVPTQAWSCLLDIWPPGNCDDVRAREQALDYSSPGGVRMQAGELVTDSPGDANGDGFNERWGWYVLRPEDHLLRFELDGRQRPRFNPLFLVTGCAGREAWVYRDNVLLEPVARDAADRLVFQVSGDVRERSLIEVILRKAERASTP